MSSLNPSLIRANRYTTEAIDETRKRCLVSDYAILSAWTGIFADSAILLCRLSDNAAARRLPAITGDCLDFSALPAFSRYRAEHKEKKEQSRSKKERKGKLGETGTETGFWSTPAETVFTLITGEAR